MFVSEKFTVYQRYHGRAVWVDIDKEGYELRKKEGCKVRKLAILPQYTLDVKSIYRANHGGTYHKVEIWEDNKIIYTSTLQHDHWGDIALTWLINQGRIPPMPAGQSKQSTLYIAEELNIDYTVTEVKRMKDL